MIYVLLQDFCKRREERRLKNGDRVRHGSANEPDKTGYAFEDVLIKVGITRVGGDFAQDIDKSLQDSDVLPDESLLRRDDNSHNTWERQLIRHQHAGIERHTHNA